MVCPRGLEAAQFTEVSTSQGINLPTVAGCNFGGMAWGDCNGDGYLDLFVGGDASGVTTRSHSLFINQGPPDYRFVDYATSAGLTTTPIRRAHSCAWLDFDGDGDQDLLVGVSMNYTPPYSGGKLALYVNDGNNPPHFEDWASSFGIQADEGLEIRFDLLDFNRDGRLDILVGRGGNNFNPPEKRLSYFFLSTSDTLHPYTAATTPLTTQLHIAEPRWVRSIAFCDFDADGDQDVYIGGANGATAGDSCLFVRDATDTFTTHPDFNVNDACRCVAWSDFDNDGDFDLLVTTYNPAKLYVNMGPPSFRFREGHTSYSLNTLVPRAGLNDAKWADFNNDGYEDLFICEASGHANWLFQNVGGTRFVDVASSAGVASPDYSGMAAWGDYDNDGDMDLVFNEWSAPYVRLMRNNQNDNHYLKIVPVDQNGWVQNQHSAVVKLYREDGSGSRTLVAMRTIGGTAGGYAASQYVAHFGVDPALSYYVRVIFANGVVRDWQTNLALAAISPTIATGSHLVVDTRGDVYIGGERRTGVPAKRAKLYR